MKIDIVHPTIEQYYRNLLGEKRGNICLEMEARAKKYNFPIIGPLAGSCLQVMAASIGAKHIFEFGSGYGYSAFWFASSLPADGKVICTDLPSLNTKGDRNSQLAQDYLSRAQLWDKIDFREGLAQDTFLKTEGAFDIIYNDVEKNEYPEVWNMAKARIRPGGLYIVDNILWRGRVAGSSEKDVHPGWTEAIRKHNQMIADDPEFDFFINPIRDGLIIARRKSP